MRLMRSPFLPNAGGLIMVALVSAVVLSWTGCSQAKIVAAVKALGTTAESTKAALPAAAPILADLQIVDPEAEAKLKPIYDAAGPALDKVIAACAVYVANPSAGSFQTVLNFADIFVEQVDQAALAIAGIKNTDSQKRALAWISGVATGLHVLYAIIKGSASSSQVQAVPKTAHVPFEQIRPFLDRQQARRQLAELGYDADGVLKSNAF